VVHEIDGNPAVEVYRSELEHLGFAQPGEDILHIAARYPIGVRTLVGERLKIRTPMAIDGSNLILAGSLTQGDRIRLMSGTTESMISAAKEMTDTAIKALKSGTPRVQLVIDCAGRKTLLGENYKDQVKAFRVDQNTPMLGFTSYGEIARYGGSLEGFHNTTAVTAIW
ncbi:MAG: FIST C-terminal domain-containing protein, partial [Spirochaetota bacterium]